MTLFDELVMPFVMVTWQLAISLGMLMAKFCSIVDQEVAIAVVEVLPASERIIAVIESTMKDLGTDWRLVPLMKNSFGYLLFFRFINYTYFVIR